MVNLEQSYQFRSLTLFIVHFVSDLTIFLNLNQLVTGETGKLFKEKSDFTY